MEWLEKMVFPFQRVWSRVASRFRFRNNGELLDFLSSFDHYRLSMLHQEVKACEYEDVQIMWEMLKRSETELSRSPEKSKRILKLVSWARLAPCLAGPL